MRFLALATALLVSAPAYAGNWQVSPDSKITFTGTQSGEAFTGTLPAFTADITFDPASLETSHVSVTMPLAGTTTGSGERDSQLPTADWFDVANHPDATFESSSFSKVDDTHFTAKGTLTIRGVSQPLDLPFALVIDGDKALMTAEASLKRMSFEVGKNWPANGDVADDVKVNVALNATRVAAEAAPVTTPVTDPVTAPAP